MSVKGQKRRLVQWTAAPRLPLYATADQTRAALQYAAMGMASHTTVNRLDGWIGRDPSRIPNSIAREIAAALPPLGRSEVDRIRTRIMARQMVYERKKKVFGLHFGGGSVC
jgi:hypothetical protein